MAKADDEITMEIPRSSLKLPPQDPPIAALISVAHTSRSRGVPGAASLDEYEISKRASLALMRNLMDEYEIELCTVGPIHGASGATGYMKRKIEKINACMPGIALEIHCNGAGDPRVDYREVIYWPGSEAGKRAATLIAEALTKGFPQFKACRARANDPKLDLHWMALLKQSKPPALIIEGFFLSNPYHLECLEKKPEGYGLVVAEGLRKFLEETRGV